jgi:hypothetical protein
MGQLAAFSIKLFRFGWKYLLALIPFSSRASTDFSKIVSGGKIIGK